MGSDEILTSVRRAAARARVAVGASIGVAAFALSPGVARAAGPCGTGGAFASTGSLESCSYPVAGEDTFVVPSGVGSVHVVAVGGAGGPGGAAIGLTNGGPGGEGGQVSASLSVTPSSTLFVEVGSNGAAGTTGLPNQNVCPGGAGGGNGGGAGADSRCALGGGGGGGGASDLRTSAASAGGLTAAAGDPRLLVAGGGGGGGGQGNFFAAAAGGAGGSSGGSAASGAGAGGDASDNNCDQNAGSSGGPGDVGPGGGIGGTTACQLSFDQPGGDGAPGLGGAGGDGNQADGAGGGGGGSGYAGGGGGDAIATAGAGGGGGGSSFGPLGASYATTTDAASVTISWTVVAPTASIAVPTAGAVFAVGQAVASSFTCADAGGTAIASCVDQDGHASGAAVDTSTPGVHTFEVTATSTDGLTGHASETYSVAAAPSAQITSPATAARYMRGQQIRASYSCDEGSAGPGLASCTGTVADGQPIATSTPGRHGFTVTATSRDGQVTVTKVSYTVVLPDNHFTVAHIKTSADGAISFEVKVPGPGTIDVLATAWNDNLAHAAMLLRPATDRFVYARKHTGVAAHAIQLRVTPNQRGRRLVGHHTYGITLRLWITYTPAGGRQRSSGFYGLHLP